MSMQIRRAQRQGGFLRKGIGLFRVYHRVCPQWRRLIPLLVGCLIMSKSRVAYAGVNEGQQQFVVVPSSGHQIMDQRDQEDLASVDASFVGQSLLDQDMLSIFHLLQKHHQSTKLNLSWAQLNSQWLPNLPKCVTYLYLKKTVLSGPLQDLTFLKRLQHLKILDLTGLNIQPGPWTVLASLQSCEQLILDHIPLVHGYAQLMDSFWESVSRLKLKRLSLNATGMGVPCLVRFPGLKDLSLQSNSLANYDLEGVSHFLDLESLDLSGNPSLSDLNILKSLCQLKSLKVTGNHLHNEAFRDLDVLHQMREFEAEANDLSDAFGRIVTHWYHIRYLHLKDNHFQGQILRYICWDSPLVSLDLSRNPMDESVSTCKGQVYWQHLAFLSADHVRFLKNLPDWAEILLDLHLLNVNGFLLGQDVVRAVLEKRDVIIPSGTES